MKEFKKTLLSDKEYKRRAYEDDGRDAAKLEEIGYEALEGVIKGEITLARAIEGLAVIRALTLNRDFDLMSPGRIAQVYNERGLVCPDGIRSKMLLKGGIKKSRKTIAHVDWNEVELCKENTNTPTEI